ncbi:YegP family protein [Tundrisphaera sp. TA3]|uniref:YegP family protein n=1 Tax=Tundrisphaera sp. TA3 TaxID=3435775 RepID=UPI003EB948C0
MFVLKAGNNEVILTSELYTQKHNAESGIESVRANAADDARFERRTSVADQPYFVLKAGNGEIIGTSEMYASNSSRERGIASVKRNSQFTPVDDQTSTRVAARA